MYASKHTANYLVNHTEMAHLQGVRGDLNFRRLICLTFC